MIFESENEISLIETSPFGIKNGVVISVVEDKFTVLVLGVKYQMRVAFSCLVKPITGDTVLCSHQEFDRNYILSILERTDSQDLKISFPKDATLITESGSLNIVSKENISLISEDNLNCISKKVIHKSNDAIIDFKELTAKGENVNAVYKKVCIISNLINTMAKNVIQKAQSFIRNTEGLDQVKAGQMTRKTEGLFSMDSKHTIMVSKKDTKIDGERIHMG
jgi:hypothetical protein